MHSERKSKHLFSIDTLGLDGIVTVLNEAENFRKAKTFIPSLAGKVAGLCFFQQSTRTRVGFDAAMKRLGGATLSVSNPRGVPQAPFGESIEDTVRVVSAYCDVIVLRHADTDIVNSAMHASVVPVINAGSGTEHHPTQTLIDLFQIQKRFGNIAGLHIGIIGDLPTSRVARSLVRALRYWQLAELRLMSPPGRQFSQTVLYDFNVSPITTINHLDPEGLDVLYVAGLPNPGGSAPFSPAIRRNFAVNAETLRTIPRHCIILCPLPRIDEIDPAVDVSSKAAYFQQSDDGLWVRMAVLQSLLS